ncbi:MAG TPA: polysaccharide deacetylase family protein [Verrucomicrobiae bacterium]
MSSLRLNTLLSAIFLLAAALPIFAQDIGETRIAKWKDDRTATFLLMFDDSWPSHVQVAAPELVKRGMIATFYICPGKGEHLKFSADWDNKLWKQGMVYGNHTMTHKGVKDYTNAITEIGNCAQYIRKVTGAKETKLISYGQPGVGPKDWNITAAQLNDLLKQNNMIDRPPFANHGAVYHWKTKEEMLALADKAITNKGMEYLVIHGVERLKPDWGYQDFWALKQDIFLPLLDALKERQDKNQLWITDHISAHQYETERNSAEVRVVEKKGDAIRLELKSKADPIFYDHPLTLITQVPADWKQASVTQGTQKTSVKVENGSIRYDALPGSVPIVLEKAN